MFFILLGSLSIVLFVLIIKGKMESGSQPYFMDYLLMLFLGYNGLTAFTRCWAASVDGVTLQGIVYATFTVACFAVLHWAWKMMKKMQDEWS